MVLLNPSLMLRISLDLFEYGSSMPEKSSMVAFKTFLTLLVPLVELGLKVPSLMRVCALVDYPVSLLQFLLPPTAVAGFLLIIVEDGQYDWLTVFPSGDKVRSRNLLRFS
jgi:hypothetical protein